MNGLVTLHQQNAKSSSLASFPNGSSLPLVWQRGTPDSVSPSYSTFHKYPFSRLSNLLVGDHAADDGSFPSA
jgi:hypothetical protein